MKKMNILIDTNIAIFAMSNKNKLNNNFIKILESLDNRIFVSMASVWEVAIKSIKHPDKIPINEIQFIKCCEEMEFEILPIKVSHLMNLRNLILKDDNVIHNDPFDRLLLSQSVCENFTFYTTDTMLLNYDIENIKII